MKFVESSVVVAAILCGSVAGCSFGMERLQNNFSPMQTPRCSAGSLPVAVDLVVGSIYAVAGGVMLTDDDDDETRVGMVSAGVGGLFLLAAYLGNRWQDECTSAREQHDFWLHTNRDPYGAVGVR